MEQPEKKHNERNAGRRPIPPNKKKVPVTIWLLPSEVAYLKEKYGSIVDAVRSLVPKKLR